MGTAAEDKLSEPLGRHRSRAKRLPAKADQPAPLLAPLLWPHPASVQSLSRENLRKTMKIKLDLLKYHGESSQSHQQNAFTNCVLHVINPFDLS
jgi:hypothetical protein